MKIIFKDDVWHFDSGVIHGKRKRKQFNSYEQAKAYMNRAGDMRKKSGEKLLAAWLSITDLEMARIVELRKLVTDLGQEPTDCDERQGLVTYQANCILIAHSLVSYRAAGFSGLLMPCPHIRKKGPDLVESGIAYIGAPDPQGIECLDRPFEPSFDGQFGHGFTTMMTTFIRALQHSSRESGISLCTCIGLDVRPRSHLETLGFGFMVIEGTIVCLKTHVSENDPVWTILRATGITELYHVPSIPAGIDEADLAVAKPSVT